MGNTASVEELGRGRRTSHKLSKPRTGNPETTTTNKLLSPVGQPNPRRRFSTSRTTSLPYGTSPAPDPYSTWLSPADMSAAEATSTSGDDQPEIKTRSRSRSITRAANAIFRSRSSQTPHGSRRQQQGSVGRQTPSQSALPSRANSMIIGASESSYTQFNSSSWQASGSRTSAAYDLNSYEAKRLLNLVEEPSGENNSIVSDSQFQVRELAVRDSIALSLADAPPAGGSIARANSDISMYAPMRRRSLLVTPGLATRRPEPSRGSRNARARFSLPSTPARRDSFESAGDMFSIPVPTIDPQSIPRASTPCDDDYGHIGAFKLGSLRITNGSPVASPLSDLEPSQSGYFGDLAYRSPGVEYFERHLRVRNHTRTSSLESASHAMDIPRSIPNNAHLRSIQTAPQIFLQESSMPELPKSPHYLPHVDLSPPVIEAPDAHPTGLQTTSKHSALEDNLFQDEQEEILQPEVLDVRVDLNAKSLPPRPRLISEGRTPRAMMRSDSGVAATPISEHPHGAGALSKSDSGYSSNISLRSFSAKPPVPEKEESPAQPIDVPPQTPAKDSFPVELGMGAGNDDMNAQSATPKTSKPVAPPVPRKDLPVSDDSTPTMVLPISTKVAEFFGERAFVIEQKTLRDTARSGQDQPDSLRGSLDLPPLSPSGSVPSTTSSSNGSNGARKPGKLERLISNARKPLAIHVTQPPEKDSATAASRHDREEQGGHGGGFSKSLKRLALKPVSSRATLGTIYSVGSAEAREEEPPLPSVPTVVSNALEVKGGRPNGIAGPRPLPRKPLPIRKNSIDRGQHLPTLTSTRDEPLSPSSLEVASATSMSPRSWEPQSPTFRNTDRGPIDNVPSSPVNETDSHPKARYAPPVSMKTRTQASIRIVPPSRSKSTPPVARQTSPAPPLPRKASRENMQYHPPNKPSLSRRSSRESVHSYPPAQLHYESLDYHMATSMSEEIGLHYLANVQARNTTYRQPDWQVKTGHEIPSERSSLDQSRQNSLPSSSNYYNSGRQEFKPRLQNTKTPVRPSADAVRRLSSYGSHGRQQDRTAVHGVHHESYQTHVVSGAQPSHGDAPGAAIDPWAGRTMIPKSLDQQPRNPPHVPRGHSRTHSLGSHGSNAPPYRILHSYNSPAYRNAPIWG
ncbi:hypothetical protein PFICI_09909 [Pestalotiopsis fici W106-1]|uniref:Uncharacterized protein n=1 Tax=Pestalotiopsis fici (strain W106-1 / CGMCC3.15140) TaxID=1229662 RepID=W3WXK0_PESFW|nr:uncharacterized protein PFICI_09909 [Pestalotiopsis fici W106-1]ETS77847.1 hypothetical protein PFICI_09909 [Pestalotiopsis fici W106-1]